jgi:hypothetical protein
MIEIQTDIRWPRPLRRMTAGFPAAPSSPTGDSDPMPKDLPAAAAESRRRFSRLRMRATFFSLVAILAIAAAYFYVTNVEVRTDEDPDLHVGDSLQSAGAMADLSRVLGELGR